MPDERSPRPGLDHRAGRAFSSMAGSMGWATAIFGLLGLAAAWVLGPPAGTWPVVLAVGLSSMIGGVVVGLLGEIACAALDSLEVARRRHYDGSSPAFEESPTAGT